MGSQVDGLVSGLNTTDLINQLMTAEAMPQTKLKATLVTAQSAAATYRAINTKVDALRTAADALMLPGAWQSVKTTSTSASVTAVAGTGATAGTLTFKVDAVAAVHTEISAVGWGATTEAYAGKGSPATTVPLIVYNRDGSERGRITPVGTGLLAEVTLADTVKAINDSGFGLSALAVQTAPGQFKLQVTSTTSGAAGEFSLAAPGHPAGGVFATVTAGADAKLHVGTGVGAFDVTSPTNQFQNVMPGVTLNVSQPEATTTVTVSDDPNALADKVKGLVDAANAALTDLRKYGASSATSGGSGIFAGDTTLSRMTSDLTLAVTSAVGTLGSAVTAGLQSDRNGTIVFDKAKFLASYATDPVKVKALVMGRDAAVGPDGLVGTADDVTAVVGVTGRLSLVATAATDKYKGSLTLLAQGRDAAAVNIKDSIETWDIRLAARKTALQRQFTTLETVLSRNASQSAWLAGQINSLPTWG